MKNVTVMKENAYSGPPLLLPSLAPTNGFNKISIFPFFCIFLTTETNRVFDFFDTETRLKSDFVQPRFHNCRLLNFRDFLFCQISSENGGFGRRFVRGIVFSFFFTNSGLRGSPLTFYFQKL